VHSILALGRYLISKGKWGKKETRPSFNVSERERGGDKEDMTSILIATERRGKKKVEPGRLRQNLASRWIEGGYRGHSLH